MGVIQEATQTAGLVRIWRPTEQQTGTDVDLIECLGLIQVDQRRFVLIFYTF